MANGEIFKFWRELTFANNLLDLFYFALFRSTLMNFRGYFDFKPKNLILVGTNFGEFYLNLPMSPKLVPAKINSLKVIYSTRKENLIFYVS